MTFSLALTVTQITLDTSSSQMTGESNYVIAIGTPSDWLKSLAPVFHPVRCKTKTDRTENAQFFPSFGQVPGNC